MYTDPCSPLTPFLMSDLLVSVSVLHFIINVRIETILNQISNNAIKKGVNQFYNQNH